MALLMNVMRRATSTTPTLFKRFNSVINNGFANNGFAPVAAACLSSSRLPVLRRRGFSSTTMNDEDNCTITANGGSFTRSNEFSIRRGTYDQNMENPFQVSGPGGAYEVKTVDEGLFVRIEMPGIAKEDIKLGVEYGNVSITGEGRRESEHEDSGRCFSANIELSSSLFEPRRITAELKNGVLRMLIPLAKNYESPSGFSTEIRCS